MVFALASFTSCTNTARGVERDTDRNMDQAEDAVEEAGDDIEEATDDLDD
ncbi:MAG: entericidin [Bacteroidota bacterium]|nr:entericidin [Bacteroidota bacterium]